MSYSYLPKVLFLLVIIASQGCMSTRLVGDYSSDNILTHKKTTFTLLWGLLQPKDLPSGCESKTICKVTTQTNLGFILLSAASLGLVVPQKITWDCCPSKEPEEKLNKP
jgi:hypothetical protein